MIDIDIFFRCFQWIEGPSASGIKLAEKFDILQSRAMHVGTKQGQEHIQRM